MFYGPFTVNINWSVGGEVWVQDKLTKSDQKLREGDGSSLNVDFNWI